MSKIDLHDGSGAELVFTELERLEGESDNTIACEVVVTTFVADTCSTMFDNARLMSSCLERLIRLVIGITLV